METFTGSDYNWQSLDSSFLRNSNPDFPIFSKDCFLYNTILIYTWLNNFYTSKGHWGLSGRSI